MVRVLVSGDRRAPPPELLAERRQGGGGRLEALHVLRARVLQERLLLPLRPRPARPRLRARDGGLDGSRAVGAHGVGLPLLPVAQRAQLPAHLLQQQQQQQTDSRRAAAPSMLLVGGGDDMHKFFVRSPRLVDRGSDLASSPAARQIYLTFPADSTFSEEDVSNYFSFFGPVQDVPILYQQKRMFGFVTFVYAETVRLILAKGNPHFVCGVRVLVKPYKEKGKVPDRFSFGMFFEKNNQFREEGKVFFFILIYFWIARSHHGDFPGCMTPTGLLDSRDPFDLQSPQIGPRMMYGNIGSHEAFLCRKLEEQQQAAELQQAIKLQGRRFMGLHLLDLMNRGHHQLVSPVGLCQ